MVLTVIITAVTCAALIVCVLVKPSIKIFSVNIGTYWLVSLLGAIAMLVLGRVGIAEVWASLTASSAVNPIKILVLFISMTILSIALDELGFFAYVANRMLAIAKGSQLSLFCALYLTVSLLTVVTSNDIIILTFTPFICYFAKNAKIDPIPYLISEFIAANTWSMFLIIGNPTNIYLATSYGVTFVEYLKWMILPTLAGGIVSFGVLLALFYKKLKQPITPRVEETKFTNKPALFVGIAHLAVCILLLAVSSYLGLEMWMITLVLALSLFVISLIVNLSTKKDSKYLLNTLKRAPYELIPFVLSMFVIVLALQSNGVTEMIAAALQHNEVFEYGILSYFAANLINNIPMSVLFSSILNYGAGIKGMFAAVVGSNLGALFTPIGALAGIMWTNLLKKHDVDLGFAKFIKYGSCVSIPALLATLGVLALV